MWTLVGMGVTAVLALIMTILAYIAQSPRALLRLGLAGYRLDLRVKLFTGYALASLILMLGFFLAGVPLGEDSRTTASSTPIDEITTDDLTQPESGAMSEPAPASTSIAQELPEIDEDSEGSNTQTPSSGAFGGPPPSDTEEAQVVEEVPPTATPEQAGPSATPSINDTPTVSAQDSATATPIISETATAIATPTATTTPLPTSTPTPTITPTPIEGETAVINTNGSTLWVRRSPGGQQLVLVLDDEIVLLENGRANQGGILWREIRTLNGIVGWVQIEFLDEEL